MSDGAFQAYVGLLVLSALALSVLAARGFGQSTGARVLDGVLAAGFLGYAGYLILADPASVLVVYYAFLAPIYAVVHAVRRRRRPSSDRPSPSPARLVAAPPSSPSPMPYRPTPGHQPGRDGYAQEPRRDDRGGDPAGGHVRSRPAGAGYPGEPGDPPAADQRPYTGARRPAEDTSPAPAAYSWRARHARDHDDPAAADHPAPGGSPYPPPVIHPAENAYLPQTGYSWRAFDPHERTHPDAGDHRPDADAEPATGYSPWTSHPAESDSAPSSPWPGNPAPAGYPMDAAGYLPEAGRRAGEPWHPPAPAEAQPTAPAAPPPGRRRAHEPADPDVAGDWL